MPEPLTAAERDYLAAVLDLARDGRTAELLAEVAAGLPANLTTSTGDTLLILAAYHSRPDTVIALLGAGADPERVNDRGQTALGAAVFRRCEPAVRALLDAGAGPDTGPRSARDLAAFFDLPDMTALLDEAR